ncbi:hypothetical protein K3N28_10225 [Glycomyces sp. TRM65418]|uniref:hypothetical protein n=1 Tax=Glycomyces sp. TRM65418 TaxID=2867006 RepID=UPI001CE59B45|nr:hypothetical protein [Glycomyces sp. TRM65418]MCC3763449.1 hypothetical protein [Glycomyces sp. TRM65418]QZD57438.1 hypothetical protein K3N28_10165 [Glycomyces sp. TRM65418]
MRTAPALLLPLVLGMTMLGACTGPTEPEDPTPAPSTAAEPAGEVYVLQLDTHEGDDGEELSLQRPESMILSEFSHAENLEWEAWGGDSAVATGNLHGMFCVDGGCEGPEYEVALVLCEVVDDHYRRFGVFGDFPEFDDGDWAFGGPLYMSGIPADDDWSNGCAAPADR